MYHMQCRGNMTKCKQCECIWYILYYWSQVTYIVYHICNEVTGSLYLYMSEVKLHMLQDR
jgi:hypothetical protein